MTPSQKLGITVFSAIAGVGVVIAGFKYSALNWIVDGPGWIVGRFFSVDFHEGEGALGFFLALFLAWFLASAAVWIVLVVLVHVSARAQERSA